MCVKDNEIIFEITDNECKIPYIQLKDLKDILFRKLKLGKACDTFMLTVEHLRYAGNATLLLLIDLLNLIIDNLNYLSSPQLNTSIASIVFKGKDKPKTHHKSYRQVRVSVLIGRLLDEHIRPVFINASRPQQNINQYGFTADISYLMGALQRHEAEQHCIDMKKTFFGCSLDGDSAFEVVNREILTRELYMNGDRGDFWKASHYSYQNSSSRIKMNGKISRPIEETKGVKQGNSKSSDHYTVYNKPILDTLENSSLGVWIGPINTGVSGVADDDFLMSDDPMKLQGLIDIAEHYGKTYRITYGASKTKITISGSDIDRNFYKDTTPWTMDGAAIEVVENNDHLGQIVSGCDQISKNIELRIKKGRGSLFGLLGPAFAYKCLLSPVVKLHLYRTYICPIVRSGLSTFPIRQTNVEPLSIYQRKVLRSILKLSKSSYIPAIHFLTGELPIEGKIHRDVFSLFFNIWKNPNTKMYEILKYLLETSNENSRTWSIYLRHISKMYGLLDPIECLQKDPPKKSLYKEHVLTKITAFHENELRKKADTNDNLKFLNVSILGLRGKHHPSLSNLITSHDVQKSQPHIKMLCNDYYTYEKRANQSGGSPHCRSCSDPNKQTGGSLPIEDIIHILTVCSSYADTRERILKEFSILCHKSEANIDFNNNIMANKNKLCQFLLDPTSINLDLRINVTDPLLPEFFKLSRDLCHSIHTKRMNIIKEKNQEQKKIPTNNK